MSARRDDRLSLQAILCLCHIGVTEAERRQRQKIEVDLELYTDLEEAGRSAAIDRTIDYREVCDAARGLMESTTFHLIETAARDLLQLVHQRFKVRRAVVRVRKFILPGVAHVEVQMERGPEA